MGGFSKAYAMTGWRVGYVAGAGGDPRGDGQGPPVRDHVGADDGPGRGARRRSSRARPTSSGCSPSTTAAGGCIVDGLNALGLETFEPRGAFYAFPRIGSTGLDDETFAERLLDRGARGRRSGQRLRAVRRRATCGCATRPRTSGWRRRCGGSAGSWSELQGLSRAAAGASARAQAPAPRRSSASSIAQIASGRR